MNSQSPSLSLRGAPLVHHYQKVQAQLLLCLLCSTQLGQKYSTAQYSTTYSWHLQQTEASAQLHATERISGIH